MSQSGKTGFYFRVIKEGYVHQSDNLKLIKRQNQTHVYL